MALIYLLHIIVVLRHFQQLFQHGPGGDELGVSTVHQPYATHLVKRYRVELFEYLFHIW
jgi:hypothetical protein